MAPSPSSALCMCLFFSTLLSSSLSELCNPTDKQVLLKIKQDLNNPYVLASWDPKTDCCDWYCVTCDETTHRINSLTVLTDNNLAGRIPASVGDLPYLDTLEFHKLPNLTGTIQPTIAKLTKLKTLRLSWNSLTGPVPDFLAQLKNLMFLDLSFNKLTGTIPPSLSQLPNIASLQLSRNQLTGPMPESFGHFVDKVPDLYFSHNQLSGTLPASLANMIFNRIDLSRNKFEGDASMLFGSNKSTQIVDLSRNAFQFDISKVEFPTSLISLDLNHNKLTGSLPQEMTSIGLQFFNVSYNRLCGQIPVGGKLQSFDIYSYFHNKCLCGAPLDSCK